VGVSRSASFRERCILSRGTSLSRKTTPKATLRLIGMGTCSVVCVLLSSLSFISSRCLVGRRFKAQTFDLPNRHLERVYMLANDAARVSGFCDSILFSTAIHPRLAQPTQP
jgi:Chromatin remodelling complex Rsc7/Swp82 subunit